METNMEVTRVFVQLIPSQLLPQGSAPFQFGGRFFQLALIAFRAATATEMKWQNM